MAWLVFLGSLAFEQIGNLTLVWRCQARHSQQLAWLSPEQTPQYAGASAFVCPSATFHHSTDTSAYRQSRTLPFFLAEWQRHQLD